MAELQGIPVPRVDGRDLGDEYLFYDREGDRVHVLNESAREIFMLCDGRRTTQEVATAFAGSHAEEADRARRDAAEILGQLADLGLIAIE